MAKKNNAPAKPKLPPEEALYQAVSLCRKAGALTMGFDAVEEACVKSKAWLVMTASDISPKTLQHSSAFHAGNGHLRTCVDWKIREIFTDKRKHSHILHQHSIESSPVKRQNIIIKFLGKFRIL